MPCVRVSTGPASLCPLCLKRIPSTLFQNDGKIYMHKECPEHGPFDVLIWAGDVDSYREWRSFGTERGKPHAQTAIRDQGCPYDCGLCGEHRAATCVAVIEVTLDCNLNCPICFADASSEEPSPTIHEIQASIDAIVRTAGFPSLQLSGGEPTVRDDLPFIVAGARERGFNHIQVNTNGIRIAEDEDYAKQLRDSGADVIFLSFDGTDDEVYRRIRGRQLLDVKERAIQNCSRLKLGVILVPTLVRSVNDHEIGAIIRFAKEHMPTVKGIHWQPMSFFGRCPAPANDKRITIPDLLKLMREQTSGEVMEEDFAPRKVKESFCGFQGSFVLETNGTLLPLTSRETVKERNENDQSSKHLKPVDQVRDFLARQWKYNDSTEREPHTPGSWNEFIARAETHTLSISCMPFQDAWNISLDRLQGCCIHVMSNDHKLVPLCAYYCTRQDGRRLFRGASRKMDTSRHI